MREIKFRAWDKIEHSMHFFTLRDWVGQWIATGGHEIMQFTGLLDKNGKEIYEGDIVKNNDINWKIDFYDGCYVMREIGKETNKWIIIAEAEHCEIIGNIYENPELIK